MFIMSLISLIVCVLAVIRVETVTRSARRKPAQQPGIPTGPCVCTHQKSFHEEGKGRCRDLDDTKVYMHPDKHGGNPPCACQLYIPKDAPVALPEPPAPPATGGYDPVYTAFLEWFQENWDTVEGRRTP